MALVAKQLNPVGGQSKAGQAPCKWLYYTDDAIATVGASGYFDNGSTTNTGLRSVLNIGDLIDVVVVDDVDTIATISGVATLQVEGNSSGVITTTVISSPQKAAVSGSGATKSLIDADAGPVLMDRAAGIVFTLPAPKVGLEYDFIVTTSLTSNAYTVNTDGASTFIVGSITGGIEGAATDEIHFANGTTHVGISMNATTTGGLVGTRFKLKAISATLWAVEGVASCTATPATPFTT